MLELLLTLVFAVTLVLTSAILTVFDRSKKPIEKIEKYFYLPESVEQLQDTQKNQSKALVVIPGRSGKKGIELPALNKMKQRTQLLLDKADVPLTAEEIIFFGLVIMAGMFFISVIVSRNIFVGFALAIIAFFSIRLTLITRYKKRMDKINEQLADALDMISGSIKTGYSFLRALEVASREMPKPISKELARIVKEVQVGLTIERAFQNMIDRLPMKDLELLITAIVLQKQTGGNLAEIFDNIGNTIRDRLSLKREVKTITAQGVLSGWIIALIPVFIVIILMFFNPSYITILFTDSLGIFFLIIALFNEIVGVALIRRIINIEY